MGEQTPSADDLQPLELYVLRGCPYCRRVERRLELLDLEYVTHDVPRRHANRTTVAELSGQTEVPVLVDPNTGLDGLAESSDIVAYLEETYDYPDGVDPNRGLLARLRSFFG